MAGKYPKLKPPRRKLKRGRRVTIHHPGEDRPWRVRLRKTPDSPPDGARPLVVLLRAMATQPGAWWTSGQMRNVVRRVMYEREFWFASQEALRKGLTEQAGNPDWRPDRMVSEGNPRWFYRITRLGLSLVAMME